MNQSEEVSDPKLVLSKWVWRSYVPHLLISVLTGLILFGLLIYSAWVNLRSEANIFPEQSFTHFQVHSISKSVNKFFEERGRLPTDLNELDETTLEKYWFSSGPFTDEWERKFQYEVHDDKTFVVFSFGRDGKPGGIGLNADLYHDDRNDELSLPTFRQFYDEGRETDGIVRDGSCFCFAISIFLFYLLIRQDSDPARPVHLAWLVLSSVILLGLSAACGIGLLPLHIPSGH